MLLPRNDRAMKIAKPPQRTKPITIRLSLDLYAQLEADAAAQDWSVNAEINHRLRAGPVLEQLQVLTAEIASLKALVRDLQGGRGD